jgi:hypothetical protein
MCDLVSKFSFYIIFLGSQWFSINSVKCFPVIKMNKLEILINSCAEAPCKVISELQVPALMKLRYEDRQDWLVNKISVEELVLKADLYTEIYSYYYRNKIQCNTRNFFFTKHSSSLTQRGKLLESIRGLPTANASQHVCGQVGL